MDQEYITAVLSPSLASLNQNPNEKHTDLCIIYKYGYVLCSHKEIDLLL